MIVRQRPPLWKLFFIPFGMLSNDLPIGAIADTIEINLREALGKKDLPDLPQSVDYLLM